MQKKLIVLLSCFLFVSLAGNFFLLGRYAAEKHHSPKDHFLQRELSKADQKIIRKEMRQRRKDMERLRKELTAMQKHADYVLGAEPTEAIVMELLLEERQKREQIRNLMCETQYKISEKLSPEGQKVFARTAQKTWSRARCGGFGYPQPHPGRRERPDHP